MNDFVRGSRFSVAAILLLHAHGIGGRQRRLERDIWAPEFLLLEGGFPARLHQPPGQGARFLKRDRVGEHPHFPRRPLDRARELDRDVLVAGLDQSPEEPKSLTASEEEYRALAKAPQREPAVGIGLGRPSVQARRPTGRLRYSPTACPGDRRLDR